MKARLGLIICIQVAIWGCSLGDPVECAGDATKCVDNNDSVGMLYKCDGDKWGEPEACIGNARCAEDEVSCLAPACEKDEQKCENTDNGGVIKKCVDYHWVVGDSCPDGLKCKDSKTCPKAERCTTGAVQCENLDSGAVLNTCDEQGKWKLLEPCPDGLKCKDETTCLSNKCSPGEQLCQDAEIGGDTIGNIYVCGSDERWSILSACPGNAKCKDDFKTCGEPAKVGCKEDEVKCEDDTDENVGYLWRCESDVLKPTKCPNKTLCKSDTECGECGVKDTKCKDGMSFVCEKGVFVESAPCETHECYDETRCQNCEITCENNVVSMVGVVTKKCEGHAVETTQCNDVSCNPSKTDCGVCRPDPPASPGISCVNDENGVGLVTGCRNGELLDAAPCENDYSCNGQGNYGCGKCHDGTMRCKINDGKAQLELCYDGLYGGKSGLAPISCPGDATCNAQSNACIGVDAVCLNDSKNNGFIVFSDGTFKSCDGKSCNADGTACGECHIPDEGADAVCIDRNGVGYIERCENGKKVEKPCEWSAPCQDGISCAECRNDVWRCVENSNGTGILSYCENNKWTTGSKTFSCPSVGCNAKHTFCDTVQNPVCVSRVSTPGGEEAYLYNDVVHLTTCPHSYSCTVEGKCGECGVMMSAVCSNGEILRCEKGVYIHTPCSSGACQSGTSCRP